MSVIDWSRPRPWERPAPREYPRRPFEWYRARAQTREIQRERRS